MNTRIGRATGDEHWMSVSDLMAGLMLVFRFIAIIFIRTVVNTEKVYEEECKKIYQALKMELGDDFQSWDVEFLEDLTIRFSNIYFDLGKSDIPERFKRILANFFPRYMGIVLSSEYREDLREIRIEGHTSSDYKGADNDKDAYLKNMALSQDRTREILKFVFGLPDSEEYSDWAKRYITANGLSSSRLICGDGRMCPGGETKDEDAPRSRRVEFRLLTESCRRAGVYEQTGESENG